MNKHETINYIELPAKDLEATKTFFTQVFGWVFVDYGTEYIAFSDEVLEGGFYRSELVSDSSKGAALVVFYSDRLEETQNKIEKHGGKVSKKIFPFPGGRRFHFLDVNGNEFAVWSANEE